MDPDTWLSSSSCVIPAAQPERERWRNDRGWTREILRLPGRDADWALRLSLAEIEAAAAFSRFPGVQRELVLLQGNGVVLRQASGHQDEVLPPHGRARFDGAVALEGVPVDGPCHVFNLMWHPDKVRATLLHRPLVGTMYFACTASTGWAIHLIGGQARFGSSSALSSLQAGDTAWLGASPGGCGHVLQGGGELLAVRVDAGPTQQAALNTTAQ